MKADFFDMPKHLSDPAFQELLKSFPHQLKDNFGHIISKKNPDSTWPETEIKVEEAIIVGTLQAPKEHLPILERLVDLELDNKIAINRLQMSADEKEILAQDLGALLYLSENELMPFTELLERLMKVLRSHVIAENVSVFGIYDGFTLEGLAGIGTMGSNSKDAETWRLKAASIAGIAATTRRPYVADDPSKDPNFQNESGAIVPKNLICHPIIHGSTLLGVLNVSNKVVGSFTDRDKTIIQRLAKIASHLLQKHFLKLRMESHAKDSDNLGKYLSSKIAKSVKEADSVQLTGVEKKVVCLFIDIRSFTTISEGLKPKDLVNALNFYFDRLTEVIEQHEGTVDKIVGDLIMAVWNMPNDQPDAELLAVKCALEMQKEIKRSVAPYWAKFGVTRMGCGIGVNAGTAVVGNLGSSRFMNFTVIGDTVNTAQRLEASAENGEVWVSESVFPYVDGKVEKPQRIERSVRLKGKEVPVMAYVFQPLSY